LHSCFSAQPASEGRVRPEAAIQLRRLGAGEAAERFEQSSGESSGMFPETVPDQPG